MDKESWKSIIEDHTKAAKTYQHFFKPTIDTLADILEQRDLVYEEFIESGGEAVVEFVSDRGAVNLKRNPRLQVWEELNTQALSFWRDLGLTPAGLKKINESVLKDDNKSSSLEEALKKLSSG